MTVALPIATVDVRAAQLDDPRECRRIDDYVGEHETSEIFHRPQWSRAVERGCRQRSHYLVAEDGRGRLAGCLPLTEVRSRLFGNALVSVGFGTGGGVVADDRLAAGRLVEAGWQLATKLGCPTIELRGGTMPEGWRVKDDVYAGFVKELPNGDEAIMRAMKRRHRSIRRALAFELEVRCGRSAAHVDDLCAAYGESVRNLGSPLYPRALYEAMLDEFGEDADILTIARDGRPLASVLNFYFKGTVMAYWGGGTAESRDWLANDLMYYEVMRRGSARGCTRFDFGRSKVGTGAYSYKLNWGFEPVPLRYALRTADGATARDINPLSRKYRLQVAAWQRMPLWLANRLGPHIARGLG